MNIKIITTISEFTKLKDSWSFLLNKSEDNQVFYTWEWINAYILNVLTSEEELFIIVLEQAGKLIAVAPLKIKPKTIFFSKKRLLTNLTDKATDYNSIIMDKSYNNKKNLEKIIDVIYVNSDKWDVMKLENLNERSYLPQTLHEILTYKQFSNVAIYTNAICPYLKYSELNVKSNKKQINDISRRKRNLEKNNNIEVYINQKFDVEIFNKLVEFKNYKYTDGVMNDSKIVDFYLELAKSLPENIHFSYMKLDEDIVAVHFGFRDKNKIYYYMPSFDPNYSKQGVGMILLKHIINSEEDNVEVFDFLKGNEAYKFIWTDRMTFNYDIWAVSNTKGNFVTKFYVNLFVLFKTVPFFKNLYKSRR